MTTPAETFMALLKAMQGNVLFRLVGVTVGPNPDDQTVYLANLKAQNPGRGAGTAMMILLCDLADQCGVKLELVVTQPSPRYEWLVAWYGRFGFSGHWNNLIRIPK